MREAVGDMFGLTILKEFSPCALVITTNGTVKNSGECVMGRGCAVEARRRWPGIPGELGTLIGLGGNHVHNLGYRDLEYESLPEYPHSVQVVSFPVKHNWWEVADVELIERSAQELSQMAEARRFECVILPRPGCGNGKLDWKDVKSMLDKHLDDRFVSISFKP